MKKAIIIGATSGIGQEVAKCLLLEGWKIGVAGRRQSSLENLQRAAPDQIQIQALDVTQEDASEKLNLLIDKLGGMDLFLLSSGIGFQNMDLNMEVELNTAHTNVAGFIRMVDTAFTYFKKNGGTHGSRRPQTSADTRRRQHLGQHGTRTIQRATAAKPTCVRRDHYRLPATLRHDNRPKQPQPRTGSGTSHPQSEVAGQRAKRTGGTA